MRIRASVVIVVVAVALGACVGASVLAGEPATPAILQLTNGDFLPGELRGSDDPTIVLWRSPAFARPFEFPIGTAKAIHFPTPADAPKASGEFGFELVNDDIVFGNLLSWSDAEVELESARLGRLHVSRDQIRRINRLSGADSVYLGPNGLTGWSEPQSRRIGAMKAVNSLPISLERISMATWLCRKSASSNWKSPGRPLRILFWPWGSTTKSRRWRAHFESKSGMANLSPWANRRAMPTSP